jgi:hypothetical protein
MNLEQTSRHSAVDSPAGQRAEDLAAAVPGQRAEAPAGASAGRDVPDLAAPLAGRHVLLVAGRAEEQEGPGVNALAVHVAQAAGQVSILPSASALADLLGRRVVGRPDLVVAVLPGRGASLAAVRVAERLGTPLLALVNSDAAPSWGEAGTLRRATRVAVTSSRLRERVAAAGVAQDRIELWNVRHPAALKAFDQIAGRTLRTVAPTSAGPQR